MFHGLTNYFIEIAYTHFPPYPFFNWINPSVPMMYFLKGKDIKNFSILYGPGFINLFYI